MKFKNFLNRNIKSEFICTNESYDDVKSKYGNYERGLDTIKPGLMFVLQLTSFMDADFISTDKYSTEEDRITKTKQILKDSSKIPAIILAKRILDDWPVYDVAFWSKSNKGESSGMMLMKNMCIWRYFGSDGKNVEGVPPKWFINMMRTSTDTNTDIDGLDLFYIKDNKEVYINEI